MSQKIYRGDQSSSNTAASHTFVQQVNDKRRHILSELSVCIIKKDKNTNKSSQTAEIKILYDALGEGH